MKKQLGIKLIITWAWITMPSFLFAAEDDLYDFLWLDPDKKVYVLQNKVFEKKKTMYANLGLIKGMNTNFQSTTGLHFSYGYYFNEEWAIEGLYHSYSNNDDDNYRSIQEINGSRPFVRRPVQKYGVLAVWSPFYGKINTFNKIIYFDWSFGVGVGQLGTESNADTAADSTRSDQYTEEDHLALLGKTSLKVHINKRFNISIDYHLDNYKSRGPSSSSGVAQPESWGTNNEFIFSIGINF